MGEPQPAGRPDPIRAEYILWRELMARRLDRDEYRAAMTVLAEHDDHLHPLRLPEP